MVDCVISAELVRFVDTVRGEIVNQQTVDVIFRQVFRSRFVPPFPTTHHNWHLEW